MAEFSRPHVSFSELMLFRKECQFRWKLDNIDMLRRKIYGIHMDFGTAMHGSIERHKTRNGPVDVDQAVRIFKKYFSLLFNRNNDKYSARELEFDKDEYSGPKDFFIEAGERILRHLHECKELADAEVVYNEYPLYDQIERTDGIDIKFKGFVDMVIKTRDKRGKTILYVCDFKTCSWGWDKDKRQDADVHAQILLYKHFLCKKFKLDPKLVRTAFILLKKRPREGDCPVEFFPVSAGPVSVQRALDNLNRDISEMHLRTIGDTLVKNRESCCSDFGDICPYYDSEHCPGTDPRVTAKIEEVAVKQAEAKRKREAKKAKQKGQPVPRKRGSMADVPEPKTAKVTTEELRARLFGKKN